MRIILYCVSDPVSNMCVNSMCHNGGNCSATGLGTFTCTCPPQFGGRYCHLPASGTNNGYTSISPSAGMDVFCLFSWIQILVGWYGFMFIYINWELFFWSSSQSSIFHSGPHRYSYTKRYDYYYYYTILWPCCWPDLNWVMLDLAQW